MYEYEDGMGEISGFGGTYEAACRAMVKAGMEWLDEHRDADPQFMGYKHVYGMVSVDNVDAEGLSKAVTSSVDDCTGAMHQATLSHILHIKEVGWDVYVEEMRERGD